MRTFQGRTLQKRLVYRFLERNTSLSTRESTMYVPNRTSYINTTLFSLPLSEAREEKPLVVEILSSSCCERLSLISLTKEKPVIKGPGAEEVEGWEKRLLDVPMFRGEASNGGKWRWERLRGGRERTYSWKLRDARLVVGSMQERKKQQMSLAVKFSKTKRLTFILKISSLFFTCVTGAWFRWIASIKRRRRTRNSLVAANRRRWWLLLVLVCPQYSLSSFRNISILEVFLQPGGNDALYCVCDSTDEAWLLLIKTLEKDRKLWMKGWNVWQAETNALRQNKDMSCSGHNFKLSHRNSPWQSFAPAKT